MTRTNNDDEVPLISFVPEEHKPDKERISSFKVYSTPPVMQELRVTTSPSSISMETRASESF